NGVGRSAAADAGDGSSSYTERRELKIRGVNTGHTHVKRDCEIDAAAIVGIGCGLVDGDNERSNFVSYDCCGPVRESAECSICGVCILRCNDSTLAQARHVSRSASPS